MKNVFRSLCEDHWEQQFLKISSNLHLRFLRYLGRELQKPYFPELCVKVKERAKWWITVTFWSFLTTKAENLLQNHDKLFKNQKNILLRQYFLLLLMFSPTFRPCRLLSFPRTPQLFIIFRLYVSSLLTKNTRKEVSFSWDHSCES